MLYQASCVAIADRALLIEGAPGSGKSSLALSLIDRGARLIGDDGVELEMRGGWLFACPPPNITGLLEIRNVGIVTLEPVSAPVALCIRLDPDAPRHVEQAERLEIGGYSVPLIRLWPDSPSLPLRAEWALKIHGLT